MAMDFKAGYGTMKASPGWFRRALLLSLYSFIPFVGGFAYLGAMTDRLEAVRNGRENDIPPLPGRFADNLGTGFFLMLPVLLLVVVVFATFGLGFLLYLPFMVLYPALVVHYLSGKRELGELFQFKEAWHRVKSASEAYANYWVVALVFGFAASLVTTPLMLLAESPMLVAIVSAPSDGSAAAVPVDAVIPAVLLSVVLMIGAMAVLLVASTVVALMSYYYLGLYARQAYPERLAGTPQPEMPAPVLPVR